MDHSVELSLNCDSMLDVGLKMSMGGMVPPFLSFCG